MERNDLTWDIPYYKAFFKTSHNSYEHSVRHQLSSGLRALEYDIHDDKIQEIGDFEVYHLKNNYDVALNLDGNPDNFLLTNWLKIIKDWSNEQKKDHAPITLFIEFKDGIVGDNNKPDELYGIKKLNDVIINSFSTDTLYTYKDFRENNFNWPTVRELKGKIVIVLTSYWGGHWASSEDGFESRLKYLTNCLEGKDDVCFVSWIDEDKGEKSSFLKEKTYFWKCSLDYSKKKYNENVEVQRLTRVDFDKIVWGRHVKTYFNKDFKAGYRCNFPSTDSWETEKYDISFPWSI